MVEEVTHRWGTADLDGSSHWSYDGAANGIGALGRRCRMADPGAAGCGAAAEFDAAYGYDGDGRLLTAAHPSGLAVRHEYGPSGYWRRLLNDGDGRELLAVTGRDPWGGATGERLGNGGVVARRFDPASGRQVRQDVGLKGKLRHDARYGWRTDGLLAERSVRGVLDGAGADGHRAESFAHDGLGRLTAADAASGAAARTLSMRYDALGNLLSRTSSVAGDVDVTGYDYQGDLETERHALNAVRGARVGEVRREYRYDGTGRLKEDLQCAQRPACASRGGATSG